MLAVMWVMDIFTNYILMPHQFPFLTLEYFFTVFFEYFRQSERNYKNQKENHYKYDYENPLIVGRNRIPTHCKLRSFESARTARNFWYIERKESLFLTPNILMLTDPMIMNWDFKLLSSPKAAPNGWETSSFFDEQNPFEKVSLPGHWQLQGYDIPIYSNTTYPFAFDPPNIRRVGIWNPSPVDVMVGGTKNSHGLLHKNEPGENATGLYRHTFSLPSDWICESSKQYRYFIVFEGVDSSLTLYLNEVFVGYSQDSGLPTEFDVTDIITNSLNTSENKFLIAALVTRWCDGSYLEDQDKWWLSGIYREVYVIRKSYVHIADFEYTVDISLTKEEDVYEGHLYYGQDDAELPQNIVSFNVNVLVNGFTDDFRDQINDYAIRLELWDHELSDRPILCSCKKLIEGNKLSLRKIADDAVTMTDADIMSENDSCRDSSGVVVIHNNLKNVNLWSSETPTLYVLTLSLYSSLSDAENVVNEIESESCRVGFRDIRCSGSDNLLHVNGKPIKIAGVNRVEFDPYSGRYMTEERMQQDIALLKQFNFNAMRCAHCPPHSRWLELCDEAGIYVVDEANIETHGFQALFQAVNYLSNHKDWQGALLARVWRMFERDKNHPCIIFWSLGNESGVGKAQESMYAWLHARDTRRLVHVSKSVLC
jgi:beta-galactosidase